MANASTATPTEAEKWVAVVTAGASAVTAVFGMLGAGTSGTLVERLVRNQACLSASGFLGVELALCLAVTAVGMYARGPQLKTSLARIKKIFWPTMLLPALLVLAAAPLLIGAGIAWVANFECNWQLWWATGALVVAIVVAFGFIFAKGLVENNELLMARTLMQFGALLLVMGLVILTVPAILIYSSKERPGVSAALKIDGGRRLEATIKASGVPADEVVEVSIDPLALQDGRWKRQDPGRLYGASTGPAVGGEVDFSIELPLPKGDYSFVGIYAAVKKREKKPDDALRSAGCESEESVCTFIRMPKEDSSGK